MAILSQICGVIDCHFFYLRRAVSRRKQHVSCDFSRHCLLYDCFTAMRRYGQVHLRGFCIPCRGSSSCNARHKIELHTVLPLSSFLAQPILFFDYQLWRWHHNKLASGASHSSSQNADTIDTPCMKSVPTRQHSNNHSHGNSIVTNTARRQRARWERAPIHARCWKFGRCVSAERTCSIN